MSPLRIFPGLLLILAVGLLHLEAAKVHHKLASESKQTKHKTISANGEAYRLGTPYPQPLYDFNGIEHDYYSMGVFGGSTQFMNVVFDTDSPDVWLPGVDCQSPDCVSLVKFDASSSWSYHAKNESCQVKYGDLAHGSGQLGTDVIQFANFTIWNQTICQLTTLSSNMPMGQLYDGVVGLRRDGSVLRNLVEQQYIEEPIFTIFLDRNPDAFPCGEINFGSIQHTYYKRPLTYAPLTSSSRWQFKVDGFHIGTGDGEAVYIHGDSFEGVVATRQVYISGPRKEIVAINEKLGFEPVYGDYFASKDCNLSNSTSVTFAIAGQNFSIPSDQYAIRFPPATACISVFKSQPEGEPWIFGNALLGVAYTVFDGGNKQLGFAHRITDYQL